MNDKDKKIQALLDTLPPITLEQMESIKLMNRLDTKYVATKRQLIELLQLVQDKYYLYMLNFLNNLLKIPLIIKKKKKKKKEKKKLKKKKKKKKK